MAQFIYTKDDLKGILTNLITTGDRWEGQKRTIEVSDFWTKIITGKDHGEILLSLKPGEKEDQKKQKVRLYNSRTKYVSNKIITQIQEVYRSDNIFNEIYFTDKQDSNADRVVKIKSDLLNFKGSKSVREHLRDRYLRLNIYDPNAFMGVNFKKDQSGKTTFYPIEVRSKDVLDRQYLNGDLQYLSYVEKSSEKIIKDGKTKTAPGYKFWIFGHDWALLYHKVPSGGTGIGVPVSIKEGGAMTYGTADYKYDWYYSEYNIKAQQVPAFCVGYVPDPENDDMTFQSILYPAEELFKELIWKKATYDIHMALHGIAQKFAFVPACEWEDKELGLKCHDGTLTNGHMCENCAGSGQLPFHTSEQDIITLKIPKDVTNMLDLSKMIYYQAIPIDVINLNRQEITETEKAISLAIFNISIIDKGELLVTKTATEIRANTNSANNVLYLFATNDAQAYKFHVKQISIYNDQWREDLVIDYSYPNDFGLESVVELFTQLTEAGTSNSPQVIKSKITSKIISKLCIDNKQAVHDYENREYWRPFTDMTGALQVPEFDPSRILFIYFDQIFRNLESFEYGETEPRIPFFKLPIEKQKEEIDKEVVKFTDQYRKSKASAPIITIPIPVTN